MLCLGLARLIVRSGRLGNLEREKHIESEVLDLQLIHNTKNDMCKRKAESFGYAGKERQSMATSSSSFELGRLVRWGHVLFDVGQGFGSHCGEVVSNARRLFHLLCHVFQFSRHSTTNLAEFFRHLSIRFEQIAQFILDVGILRFDLVHRLFDVVQGRFQFEEFYSKANDVREHDETALARRDLPESTSTSAACWTSPLEWPLLESLGWFEWRWSDELIAMSKKEWRTTSPELSDICLVIKHNNFKNDDDDDLSHAHGDSSDAYPSETIRDSIETRNDRRKWCFCPSERFSLHQDLLMMEFHFQGNVTRKSIGSMKIPSFTPPASETPASTYHSVSLSVDFPISLGHACRPHLYRYTFAIRFLSISHQKPLWVAR